MGGAAGMLVLLGIALLLAVLILAAIVCRDVLRPPRRPAGYAAAHGYPFEPGESGRCFEAWTVDRPGGPIPVWEIDAEARDPAPRPATAVFIHDWGESRIDVLARIAPWARRC